MNPNNPAHLQQPIPAPTSDDPAQKARIATLRRRITAIIIVAGIVGVFSNAFVPFFHSIGVPMIVVDVVALFIVVSLLKKDILELYDLTTKKPKETTPRTPTKPTPQEEKIAISESLRNQIVILIMLWFGCLFLMNFILGIFPSLKTLMDYVIIGSLFLLLGAILIPLKKLIRINRNGKN